MLAAAGFTGHGFGFAGLRLLAFGGSAGFGRLGDNGKALREAIRADALFWTLAITAGWLQMLLIIGVCIFFMRQMQGGGGKAMGFGKSKASLLTEKVGRVTFDDVAGIDEAKQELEEIDRLQGSFSTQTVLGLAVPKVTLPVATGRELAILVEAAVRQYILRQKGYDATERFINRQQEAIQSTGARPTPD